jgi:hypothetical protein
MPRTTFSPSSAGRRLAVYVTSHGFGHLNRVSAVLNLVPPDVPIAVRSHPNLFPHWGERLKRPATLEPHISDVGTIHPAGDSVAVDARATFDQAGRVHAGAMAEVDDEADRLRSEGTAAVLSDSSPVPLVAARRAGIPGYLMANFTWADIYLPHSRALGPDAVRLVAELRRAYRHATGVFRVEPALRMAWLGKAVEPGMVVNPGRNRRAELIRSLGLKATDKLVYLYLGRYGQDGYDWANLERLAARGIHFVGYHPAPTGPIENLHVIPAADWTGGDLIASCHALAAKAGYGTVCEAMACGTPVIYPPRRGFAEFRALDRALRSWSGGVPVSTRDFRSFRLTSHLERALALKPGPPPFGVDGARRIADHLTKLCVER